MWEKLKNTSFDTDVAHRWLFAVSFLIFPGLLLYELTQKAFPEPTIGVGCAFIFLSFFLRNSYDSWGTRLRLSFAEALFHFGLSIFTTLLFVFAFGSFVVDDRSHYDLVFGLGLALCPFGILPLLISIALGVTPKHLNRLWNGTQ